MAIATFNCVLAVAVKKCPSTKSPSPEPEEIIIVAFDASGKETGTLESINKPIQDNQNRLVVPSSTHGKFVTPFPGDDCNLHIFKLDKERNVDEERIEGKKKKDTPFMYSHGVFNAMEVICHKYDG
ncbi:hypothetical protein BDP27DRAFT_1361375 [Rhodocollybia butyracea]|uniref:Uncharacterized protein n=1 Tax=Rhodocollybia butyracea TaxID=206335 RepID=A0A9P5UAE7_9AGAR|nr:hypothetical protein BDP27DRAFT_1361375 [Rhodocollybia butyracea]